jgi:hypothetical protein
MARLLILKRTEGTSSSLSECILLGYLGDLGVVELVPLVIHLRSDESIVMAVVQCSSVHQDREEMISVANPLALGLTPLAMLVYLRLATLVLLLWQNRFQIKDVFKLKALVVFYHPV